MFYKIISAFFFLGKKQGRTCRSFTFFFLLAMTCLSNFNIQSVETWPSLLLKNGGNTARNWTLELSVLQGGRCLRPGSVPMYRRTAHAASCRTAIVVRRLKIPSQAIITQEPSVVDGSNEQFAAVRAFSVNKVWSFNANYKHYSIVLSVYAATRDE